MAAGGYCSDDARPGGTLAARGGARSLEPGLTLL